MECRAGLASIVDDEFDAQGGEKFLKIVETAAWQREMVAMLLGARDDTRRPARGQP